MLIDLSHPIEDGIPAYPGDPDTRLSQSKHYEKDGYSDHALSINMHAGTHIDGPMHLTGRKVYISEFPLDSFIGEGCLLDMSGEQVIDYKSEYEQSVKPGQIVILHTGHSGRYGEPDYFTAYPAMTLAFAEMLVRKGIKMVGFDMPSPDYEPFEVHQYLFRHNVLIIENLTNVEQLMTASAFEIIALPLNIKADSSIARVIARV